MSSPQAVTFTVSFELYSSVSRSKVCGRGNQKKFTDDSRIQYAHTTGITPPLAAQFYAIFNSQTSSSVGCFSADTVAPFQTVNQTGTKFWVFFFKYRFTNQNGNSSVLLQCPLRYTFCSKLAFSIKSSQT